MFYNILACLKNMHWTGFKLAAASHSNKWYQNCTTTSYTNGTIWEQYKYFGIKICLTRWCTFRIRLLTLSPENFLHDIPKPSPTCIIYNILHFRANQLGEKDAKQPSRKLTLQYPRFFARKRQTSIGPTAKKRRPAVWRNQETRHWQRSVV